MKKLATTGEAFRLKNLCTVYGRIFQLENGCRYLKIYHSYIISMVVVKLQKVKTLCDVFLTLFIHFLFLGCF